MGRIRDTCLDLTLSQLPAQRGPYTVLCIQSVEWLQTMLSVYFSVHRLQALCHILPWDFKTHTGLILFVCYMDAYIEFLKALVSRGNCGSERVNSSFSVVHATFSFQRKRVASFGYKQRATVSESSSTLSICPQHPFKNG